MNVSFNCNKYYISLWHWYML